MDRTAYAVGDVPSYRITGAKPGATIAWTSFKNGEPTGEYQADYGHRVSEDGTWQMSAVQPWSAADAGMWQKQAVVIPPEWPEGTLETDQFFFTVGESSPAPTGNGATSGGGIFDSSINLPLIGPVPTIAALAVGGIALFALSRR
jgi:hypothetical protein